MIAIHPTSGDPCGVVYLLDDGRSYLVADGIRVIDDANSITDELDLADG
ncbi:MAG TPA: hypothetical protein VHR72_08940 [Gemmataceae bacterium]|jgi:hypothetical protein|nr:hypothetical protein [Gemmataceae bacterium]